MFLSVIQAGLISWQSSYTSACPAKCWAVSMSPHAQQNVIGLTCRETQQLADADRGRRVPEGV